MVAGINSTFIFYVLEDMVKHVPFHLKTDHMNLVYISCALTGKVARWKLYMQDWNFTVCWNTEEIETSADTDTAQVL